MTEKCTKYEALFVFGSQEDLEKHLAQCEQCRAEHEKMQKISSLVKEVKHHYERKIKKTRLLKAVCTLLFIAVSSITFSVVAMNTDITDTLKYGASLSAEDYGFPVDSYGLIMVE